MNRIKIVALIAGGWMLACGPAAAQFGSYEVIYSFCAQTACADGAAPYAPLAIDHSGTLYGTTTKGGAADAGTVFMLKPEGNDNWQYSVLHSFCTGDCADGKHPHAGLILDTDGNLYGTTTDRGVAFRLNPDTQQFDVLHAIGETYAPLSFKGARFDGHAPLYGTIARGGEFGRGAVFALKPRDDGTWRKDILWNFCRRRHCGDGSHPFGGVYVADDGHLVGVTQHGGDDVTNAGVVYELTHRQMTGTMPLGFAAFPKSVTPIYVPRASGYFVPLRGGLIEYYGAGGGYTNWGGFRGGRDDLGGAVENPNNTDIVGTASRGASTAFDPEGGGTVWLFNRLSHGLYDVHWFCQEADCADGDRPAAPPVFGGDYDVYYGTTTKGGAHGQGVVYRYKYSSPPS